MTQLNRMPTYAEKLGTNGETTRGWYSFWLGLLQGQPAGPVAAITVGASPYTYVATLGGTVIVDGGTVSEIDFSRDGVTFYNTGVTAGMLPVSQGDQLVVTWSGKPTMTFVPK